MKKGLQVKEFKIIRNAKKRYHFMAKNIFTREDGVR